jgi:hypothetical protein
MAHVDRGSRGPDAGSAVSNYQVRIRELGEMAAKLNALLTVLVANCEHVCKELDEGLSVIDSVRLVGDEAGRAFRRDLHAATTRFEHAMQAARAESFRVLVREVRIPVTELSAMTGLSAQMIRRLLRLAEGA